MSYKVFVEDSKRRSEEMSLDESENVHCFLC